MTLKNILFGALGILGLLLLAVTGQSAGKAWQQLKVAEEVEENISDSDRLLHAAGIYIAERDRIHVAMTVADTVSRDELARVRAARVEADETVREIFGHIAEEQSFAHRDELLSEAASLLDTIGLLRRQVDDDAKNGEPDFALAREWRDAVTALVENLEQVRQAASRGANDADSISAAFSMQKHFTLVVADHMGRESAVLAQHIAQDLPIPPGSLQTLFAWRGQVDLAWSVLLETKAQAAERTGEHAHEMSGGGMSGSGMSGGGMAATDSDFMADIVKIRSEVLEAGISAETYPLTARAWLAAGEEALAGIDEMQHALIMANAQHTELLASEAREELVMLVLFLAIGFAAALVSFAVVARRVVGPLNAMTAAMGRLADGDLAVEIPAAGRKDEVGRMALALGVFRENAVAKQQMEEDRRAERLHAEAEKKEAATGLADRFESQVKVIVDSVAGSATEMQNTAQQMSATAEETSRQSTAVATASDEASANVQTVATAVEEMSASIAEIGRRVSQSARVTSNAVDRADSTNDTIQELSAAAEKIGEVVTLINEIAGQTNLLALNATIEAARAGEAGKGFAVVAQEVKNLANQTAKATDDIAQQVSTVQDETRSAVGAIGEIREIIGEIDSISAAIATAVEQQGVSTQEIARNVQMAAKGTEDVNLNIGNVNKAAGETGTASAQVLGTSRQVAQQAETLRGEVEQFLQSVRAA